MMCYRLKKLMAEGKIKSAEPVKTSDKYVVGQNYWCGYWNKTYKVIDVCYENIQGHLFLSSVTVEWEDGTVGTHCTRLNPRGDYKITM